MNTLATTTEPKFSLKNYLSDGRNIAKTLMMAGVLAVVVWAFGTYVLPWLLTTTWNLLKLVAVGFSLFTALAVLTSKKFWEIYGLIGYKLGQISTFWLLDWDDFIIAKKDIANAEEGKKELKSNKAALYGEVDNLKTQITTATNERNIADEKVRLLTASGKGVDDYELLEAQNESFRQTEIIDSLTPHYEQMVELAEFSDFALKEAEFKIKDAIAELNKEQTIFESLTRGENVMRSAMRVIFGFESESSRLAKARLRKKISSKIGYIREAVETTSVAMNERTLRNKAKVSLALQRAKGQLPAAPVTHSLQLNVSQNLKSYSNLLNDKK